MTVEGPPEAGCKQQPPPHGVQSAPGLGPGGARWPAPLLTGTAAGGVGSGLPAVREAQPHVRGTALRGRHSPRAVHTGFRPVLSVARWCGDHYHLHFVEEEARA